MNARNVSIFVILAITITLLSACSTALTPEEAANEGTHIYLTTSELDCATIDEVVIEKFKISFSNQSVKIEKLEPENQAWTNTYSKVSANTYIQEAKNSTGEIFHITIEFIENGFKMSSDVPQHDCGAYIRTLAP